MTETGFIFTVAVHTESTFPAPPQSTMKRPPGRSARRTPCAKGTATLLALEKLHANRADARLREGRTAPASREQDIDIPGHLEHSIMISHPVQCSVAEDRVELRLEVQSLAVHQASGQPANNDASASGPRPLQAL